ncbi:MAG: tRNA 2-thiouridine(34) synthase MnmA, partial [Propionicimonas sp.]
MRVLAAMSGGVDSAVAAARLVDDGHEVVGVHLALSKNPDAYRSGARGCCSLEDSHDARRAADVLGIPFYVWDFAERFAEDVVDDFVSEYAAGRTPNPCLRCNEKIKFAAVLERGRALGFDAVATGHYARIEPGPGGPSLLRAAEPAKDQSYVLGVLDADQLRHSLFPLGADVAKAQVRTEAAARGLSVARKPDSHDICFIPTGDTAGFLRSRLGARAGDIVDERGEVIGAHRGTQQFTVGQRHGLHLSVPAADGRPRYVLGVDPVANTVRVGPRSALAVRVIEGIRLTWTEQPVVGAWRGLV